jgi:hypothetical protein
VGVQTEMELAFADLHQLCAPVRQRPPGPMTLGAMLERQVRLAREIGALEL